MIGALALALLAGSPAPPPSAAPAIRGVAQVFVIPAVEGGPAAYFRELRAQGFDVAVVRAFHLEGDRSHEGARSEVKAGCTFPTAHVPLVADRLASDARAAREAGLEPFAWMTTRATPMPAMGPERREVAWDPGTGRFVPKPTLDLFDEEVVRALEATFADLARAGVDGVLLQDDLMLSHLEGFSDDARAAWEKRHGRPLDPARLYDVSAGGRPPHVRYRPEFWELARFKRDRLLDVAGRLQAAGRAVRPGFRLALNLYYETALNPVMALAWFAQDLEAAAARDVHWLALMAYHRQVADELSLDDTGLAASLRSMGRPLASENVRSRLLLKYQSMDWTTREPLDPAELAGAAASLGVAPAAACIAPADDARRAGALLAAVRGAGPTTPVAFPFLVRPDPGSMPQLPPGEVPGGSAP